MNGSLTIDLDTDLEGEGLETLEGELPPQTGEATNAAGDGTQANPFQIGTWEQLNNELGSNGSQKPGEANGDPTYFKLTGDAIADSTVSTGIVVPSGRHVALDLNGKTIDRKLSSAASGGTVIKVKGDLTVMDSSSGKTGNITGGYMYGLGGGVYVGEGGMLTMSGCTISGNCAEGGGGGVYVDEDGKFTMSGGNITDNKGGGVRHNQTFNLSGEANISGNTIDGKARNVVIRNGLCINIAQRLENSNPIEPEVVVKDRSTKAPLTKDRDYTVAYKKNKNVGRATVTVAFIGDYSGVAKEKLYFKIEPKNLTVTAEDKVKVVGEADPELTYETEGLAEGDKLAGTLTRDKGEAPGEYAIRQGSLKARKAMTCSSPGATGALS